MPAGGAAGPAQGTPGSRHGLGCPAARCPVFLLLFDLVEAVIELVVRDGRGAGDGVDGFQELLSFVLAHVFQRPDEDYVEEARERVVEDVDARTRERAFDAVPVVDCDF